MDDSMLPAGGAGEPVLRRPSEDSRSRVEGTYPFAVDRRVDGAVHAAAVRTTIPHGRITRIDSDAARRVQGVLAVISGTDVGSDSRLDPYYGEARKDQPVLALEKVRYVGEPVAVVVAETRRAAEAAARLVEVEIEDLPFVVDQDEAGRPGAPLVHDDTPDNECARWRLVHGDAERALADAAYVHHATYRSPAANHAALEPHSATAAWLPDGVLEVWTGTQSPYAVRTSLAGVFRLSPDQVRIRGDNLGGAFGSKLGIQLEALVALAARAVGRPVRMELRRDEVFMSAAKHAATVTLTTGVDPAGLIVARRIDIAWNAGAYGRTTPRASRTGMIRAPGPYRIPNVLATAVARYTNTVPTGPFRGAMTGQVCWAHERAMDEMAADLGLDPLEFRRRNVLRDGDVFATGEIMTDMHYHELLDAVDVRLGRPTPDGDGSSATELSFGRGIALVLKSTRTPSRSEAFVELRPDGGLVVWTSSAEMGQGAASSLAELVAAELAVPAESVLVSQPDTARTPFDTTTSSSRTTYSMGFAVVSAARELRTRINNVVKTQWNYPGSLTHRAGRVHTNGPEPASVSYADVARVADDGALVAHGVYQSPSGAGILDPETSQGTASVHWHQGAVGVRVAVDRATGRVVVTQAHGAVYAGRLVSEARSRKQIEGGMIFGLGQALMEEVRYDDGQLSNPNLSDYQLPSMLDAPLDISSTIIASPDPDGEPHGVGETTVPPMAAAVAAAVQDALGVRLRDLPVTAERVLDAIGEAGNG